jgi:hypothetical protein
MSISLKYFHPLPIRGEVVAVDLSRVNQSASAPTSTMENHKVPHCEQAEKVVQVLASKEVIKKPASLFVKCRLTTQVVIV